LEVQLFEVQLFDVQLFELQSAAAVQLFEFQPAFVQLLEVQLFDVQLDESQLDATVLPAVQLEPGAQTSAGTPWFARPGVPDTLYDELRLSEPTLAFLAFAPCFAINAHLTVSGLQLGWTPKMIAAAPAVCGAAKEVPLIVACPGAIRFAAGAERSSVAPAGIGAPMCRPGASRSGFEKPSTVLPLELHVRAVSSPGPAVSIVSKAPVVNASGSFAGA
jgi:hypothetical protein